MARVDGALEFLDSLAEGATGFGEAFGSEDEERDDQQNDQVGGLKDVRQYALARGAKLDQLRGGGGPGGGSPGAQGRSDRVRFDDRRAGRRSGNGHRRRLISLLWWAAGELGAAARIGFRVHRRERAHRGADERSVPLPPTPGPALTNSTGGDRRGGEGGCPERGQRRELEGGQPRVGCRAPGWEPLRSLVVQIRGWSALLHAHVGLEQIQGTAVGVHQDRAEAGLRDTDCRRGAA